MIDDGGRGGRSHIERGLWMYQLTRNYLPIMTTENSINCSFYEEKIRTELLVFMRLWCTDLIQLISSDPTFERL